MLPIAAFVLTSLAGSMPLVGELAQRLSGWELRAGWRLLFDGIDSSAWHAVDGELEVVEGALVLRGGEEARAEHRELLSDFELELADLRSAALDAPPNAMRVVARAGKVAWWDGVSRYEPVAAVPGTRLHVGSVALELDAASSRWKLVLHRRSGRDAFRGLRLRMLDRMLGERIALFDGVSLAGWRAIGDARWGVDDGCIVGEVGGGRQSFLVTERTFGDFVLELELKNELPGNSGVQVRSHQDEKGAVYGYQIEVDPSARSWSGGLYDEGRRGWIANLANDALARAAFRPGEWNHYKIECVGPHVRTWVNGTRCVDVLDPLDAEGFVGLQVHSGKDTKMRWRNLVLRDLGASPWKALEFALVPTEDGEPTRWRSAEELGDTVLRLTRTAGASPAFVLAIGGAREAAFEFPARADGAEAVAWHAVFAGSRFLVVDGRGARHNSLDARAIGRAPLELRVDRIVMRLGTMAVIDARLPR